MRFYKINNSHGNHHPCSII